MVLIKAIVTDIDTYPLYFMDAYDSRWGDPNDRKATDSLYDREPERDPYTQTTIKSRDRSLITKLGRRKQSSTKDTEYPPN